MATPPRRPNFSPNVLTEEQKLRYFLASFILLKSPLLTTYIQEAKQKKTARNNVINMKYFLSKCHPAIYGFSKKAVEKYDSFSVSEDYGLIAQSNFNYHIIKDNTFNEIGFRISDRNRKVEFLVKDEWKEFVDCEATWAVLYSIWQSVKALKNSDSELQKMRQLDKEKSKYIDLYMVNTNET